MDLQPLRHLLHELVGIRVLVVGDVMLDRFVYGDVSRVSAEAPIPVLAHAQESRMLGGAGNVARNLTALGGRAELVGLVGSDSAAMEIETLAAEDAIGAGLVIDPGRSSTVKMRFVSAGQQLLRVDTETIATAPADAERALAGEIATRAPGCGAILLSDYGKGVVTPAIIEACVRAARETGARLVVDSKAHRFGQYGLVDLIKPNAAELARATDLPTDTDAEVEAALIKALGGCEARGILVTRAAKGMSLAVRGQPVWHVSRPPPEVYDTAGAGDTALAAVGLALASGASLEAAVELGLVASGLVVQKAGVAVVSPDEILEAELAASRSPLDAKIATAERMAREAARWRERGLKVGFTNGCFDILHAGHIAYLTQARSWCDRLIVGLNTDDSIRAAKGPGRPVNGLEARARVLSALAAVDLVAPFEEDTPLELIRAARPDLLVKGGDYAPEEIVGRELVLGWGGEVRVADFVDGESTTGVIRRLGGGGGR
jgi:D-beta-D-heptose 7-phosphate kinase / D-beta-D-heptose 1-phosphate adenosyltransferase